MRFLETNQPISKHFSNPLVFRIVWDTEVYDSAEMFRLKRHLYKTLAGKWGFSPLMSHSFDLNRFVNLECMYFVFEDEVDAMQFKLSLPNAHRTLIWPERVAIQVYHPIISSLNEVPTK